MKFEGLKRRTGAGLRLTGVALLTGALYGGSAAAGALPSADPSEGGVARQIVSIRIEGPARLVFDHRDKLEPYNIPDAQVTAWKDDDGNVSLMIPMVEAYRMTGPDLHRLTLDPNKLFSSSRQGEKVPENDYDFDHWFVAPYTLDGRNVTTLAHSEWYACLLVDCTNNSDNSYELNSWVTTITAFRSGDGGAHFLPDGVGERHVVAKLGYHWTGSVALARRVYHRYFDATGLPILTRLIKERGHYYALGFIQQRDFSNAAVITTGPAPTTKGGIVILRTADVTKADGWQAWVGGSDYEDLNTAKIAAFWPTLAHVPFSNVALGQMIYDLRSRLYIVVFVPFGTPGAIYYTTSRSLESPEWSEVQIVAGSESFRTDPRNPQAACNTGFDDANYVSLLDPASPGLNFEFTDGEPEVFYVVNQAACGGDNLSRDLYRAPLKITYAPPVAQ